MNSTLEKAGPAAVAGSTRSHGDDGGRVAEPFSHAQHARGGVPAARSLAPAQTMVAGDDAPSAGKRHSAEKAPAGRELFQAASNYARFAVSIGCAVLLTPLLARSLGAETFGLWALLLGIAGMLETLDLGLATATVKYVAQFQGAGQIDKRNRLASTLLAVYCALGGAAFSGMLLAAPALPRWLALPADQHGEAIAALCLLSAKAALMLPLNLFVGVLFGQRRLGWVNLVKMVSLASFAAAAAGWLLAGGGVLGLAALHVGCACLELAACATLCWLVTPGWRLDWRLFDRRLLLEVSAFSGCALVINVSAAAVARADPLLVSSLLPLAAVTLYALAAKVSEQMLLLTKQFINVFTPLLAELHGAGRADQVRAAYLRSSRLALAAAVACVLPLGLMAEATLTCWVGAEFREAAPVLRWLLAAVVARVAQEAGANVLGMTGQHRFLAMVTASGAAVKLLLGAALLAWLGLPGAAAATCLAALATAPCVLGRVWRRHQVSLGDYFAQVARPLLPAAAGQAAVTLLLTYYLPPASLVEIAIYFLLGACVFAALFLRHLAPVSFWGGRNSWAIANPSTVPTPRGVNEPVGVSPCLPRP